MSDIKEFKGLRPPKNIVEKVAELPYDVCNTEEAKDVVKGNEYSFYHITKPEIDLPVGTNQYDESVYQKGAENLEKFVNQKYLVEDEKKQLYLYTLIMNGNVQSGLVTCVSIDDYVKNVVKKHEYTREEKEQDRIKHLDVLNAQTGLVFLLYSDDKSMDQLWKQALEIEPEYDFTAEDGVRHIFRIIDNDQMISSFKQAFKDKDLYIADGHHRAASAVKNGLARREKNAAHTGDEEYNSFLTVIFPHDQLSIMAYNRAVKTLNGKTEDEFLTELAENFEIEDSKQKEPQSPKEFCMYIAGKWKKIKPKFKIENDPVKSLDVSILQNNLLNPVLGIEDPRKSKNIDFIGGIRGTQELEKLVDSDEYKVAFSLYPTSVEALISVSDNNNVMPPKSTWFEPKLRSGIILHKID
jgi:uncharacterized protein (DUF1015 family)